MSRSAPQANAPASWRPSPLRLVVGLLFAGAPGLALLISLGLAIIGMIAGTIFWLCVYP